MSITSGQITPATRTLLEIYDTGALVTSSHFEEMCQVHKPSVSIAERKHDSQDRA
ncbi:MAG: hypothetical protein KDA91_24385 [Planctomycetaceae bacterium]|nr:hypothetical protein [Planctomycetaceae bacterium]